MSVAKKATVNRVVVGITSRIIVVFLLIRDKYAGKLKRKNLIFAGLLLKHSLGKRSRPQTSDKILADCSIVSVLPLPTP